MKNKKLWFQVFAWLLCIALGYSLFNTVLEDNAKNAERFAQLQLQAANMEQTDGEKSEALADIYDKFYSQLENPQFVCWGDNAMAGSRESSLSISLQKVVNDNLYSQLSKTFSQAIEDEELTIPSVKVNNMGVTNEGMRQIVVSAGVNIMDLGEGNEIPYGNDPVTV